ncbi:MAG: hypothetical protein H6733_08620 [Alphaproteobacteria bacterium]|nr:hypothetical protein [Alphaproteobacteria bacterium]
MKTVMWVVAALVVLLVGGAGWLAWAQNTDQIVRLRFDLGASVGAWQMTEPMPAVGVAAIAFGAGLVVGAVLVAVMRGRSTKPASPYGDL